MGRRARGGQAQLGLSHQSFEGSMSGRQAAILPRPRPPPHPTPPDSLPWKLEEARRPIKGSPGPQPGRGPVSGCWSVAKLVCHQPPLLLPASNQWGPSLGLTAS